MLCFGKWYEFLTVDSLSFASELSKIIWFWPSCFTKIAYEVVSLKHTRYSEEKESKEAVLLTLLSLKRQDISLKLLKDIAGWRNFLGLSMSSWETLVRVQLIE